MKSVFKVLALTAACLCLSSMAFGQWTLFTVEEGAAPGGTTYPTLAGALATAATYPNGPHKIKILAGTYDDVNMTVANVDEIYGDPEAEPGDIIFNGGSNFLTLISGVTIQNMTIQGYDDALIGPGAGNCVIDNIIFDDNARAVVFTGAGTDNNMVSGCQILNHTSDAVQFDGNINSVVGCTFDATTGFGVYMGGVTGTVSACTFTGGGSYGVLLVGDGGTVTGCTFDGSTSYGVRFEGDLGSIDDNLFTGNGGYGVNLAWTTNNNVIEDNCFIGNNGGGVQGWDNSGSFPTGNDWHHNYWSDDAGGAYVLDGVGDSDTSPWTRENQVTGLASVEVWDPVSFDMMWMAPPCSETDPVMLAAYEFVVDYDPDFLQFVSAEYDEGYLGTTGDGALYTGIAVDQVLGEITFAATNFDLPGTGDGRLALVNFNAIGTTASTIISVGSLYRDENNNDIPAGSQSADLAIVDTEPPTITVVPDDPLGNDTYSLFYPLSISGEVTDNYCLYRVWYSWTGTGGWNTVETVSGTSDTYGPWAVTLPTAEGTHTLYLRVGDCHNPKNYGYTDYTFTVDKTGPDASGVTVTDSDGCADAGYTSSELCDVAWTDDGSAVEMELALVGTGVFVPYENPSTFTLPSIEGPYTVYVMLKDAYGNAGSWVAGNSIILDQTAPAPSAAWLVSDPTPAKTNTPNVGGDANLDAAAGAVYAKATEDGVDLECDADGWALITDLNLIGPPRFNLTLSSPPDGLKTVEFASMDAAGNIGTTSTSITLDTDAPEFDAFSIADVGGSECSGSWTVDVTVEWSAADVKWLRLASVAGGPYTKSVDISAATSPFMTTYTLTNPPRTNNAMNSVFGVLEDDIANVGGEATDEMYFDMTNPGAITVVTNGANNTWTNNPVVSVDVTGADTDVNEILMSLVSGDYSAAVVEPFDPGAPSTTFDFGTPVENLGIWLYVKVEDCADRQSPQAIGGWVAFDLTDPVLSAVTINGGAASTNNLNVSVGFTWTELHMQTVYISEASDMSGAQAFPWAGGPPYSFLLTGGDDMKDVYVQLEDFVGNKSTIETASIDYDGTFPVAGDFVITSGNTLAIAGWTNSLTGNTWAFTPADDDIVWMQIIDMSATITVDPFVEPAGGTLNAITDPGGTAPYTVQVRYRLRDDAMNLSGWFPATIMYDPVVPPAPSNASGVPGASVALSWDAVDDAQGYMIRYNFTNECPVYASGPPPFPALPTQGILEVGLHPDNSYDFEGPQDDLYAFGIWTLSNAGVWSTAVNNQVLENNYRLGDFESGVPPVLGSDGCLTFETEFFDLAAAYGTDLGGPGYNQYLDFAPTVDLSNLSPALPDGHVNFEDLVVFALNYKWSRAQTECEGLKKVSGPALASAPDITVSAEIPSYSRFGEEFTVPISISDGNGVAGYHLVFNYDREALELVSVNPGQVYEGAYKTFFYYDDDAAGIDISSAVLNDEGLTAGEIAVATFRTRISGPVTLEDALLDVRDWRNQKANVSFELAAKGGSLPTAYAVSQNYPNPFNPTTAIELALPQAGQYRLTIYNVIGQVVEVFEGQSDAGYTTFNWDASKQASGVYLYKVTVGDFSATKKMVLLK